MHCKFFTFNVVIGLLMLGLSNIATAKALDSKTLKQWERLLHLNERGQKTVIEKHFYLTNSKQPINSLNEYQANLEAMLETANQDSQHAQCQFPARFRFIKKQHPNYQFPKVECNNYSEWLKTNGADSISLVFASSYLGNPASMYGHILFKLNNNNGQSYLLDQSVNYGALTPDDENMLVYIVKGIFGGYSGYFTEAEFYNNNRLYGNVELRDLTEYELKLTEDEKNLILAHLYEMQSYSLPYYFFKENCGLQIADIISVATGDKYYTEKPWVLPFEVISQLDERNLIKSEIQLASKQTQFFQQYHALTPEEKRSLLTLVADEKPKHEKLSIEDKLAKLKHDNSRQKVARAALDYLHVAYINHKNKTLYNQQRYPILGYLANLEVTPSLINNLDTSPKQSSPLQATKPTRISIGLRNQQRKGNTPQRYSQVINFRAANNDSLNINLGRPKFSFLKMLDFTLAAQNQQLTLEELIFVEIRSIQPKQSTGLNYDEDMTWQFKVAFEQDQHSGGSYISGGKGVSFRLGHNAVFSTLLNAKAKTGAEGISLYPEARLIYNHAPFAFEATINKTLNKKSEYIQTNRQINWVYNHSKQLDFRFTFHKKTYQQTMLSIGFYF